MEDCKNLSLKYDILLKQKWNEYYEASCIQKQPYTKALEEYQKINTDKTFMLKKCVENEKLKILLKNNNTLFE